MKDKESRKKIQEIKQELEYMREKYWEFDFGWERRDFEIFMDDSGKNIKRVACNKVIQMILDHLGMKIIEGTMHLEKKDIP